MSRVEPVNKLIYIADDHENICNIIKSFLLKDGYDVVTFLNGNDLLAAFEKQQADMLIIDIMMPGLDGFSLLSTIRSMSNVPVIIVSARDSEPDKIAGLSLGSDDYLTKPFSPMELAARVKSIFRRIELDKTTEAEVPALKICDIVFDAGMRNVNHNGVNLCLTPMEFNLLLYLAENKNKAVSRNELLNKIWGFKEYTETRATDDMIKRIRKKLNDAGSCLKIETVWGYGFRIVDDEITQ